MKKIKKFYKGLLVYFGVLIIISGVVIAVLWNFLKCFEYSKPDSVMAEIVELIQDGDGNSEITKYLGIADNPFETKEIENEYFAQITKDKEIDFRLITDESTDTLKTYHVKADGVNLMKISLKELSQEGGFGFDEWEIKDAVFLNEYKILVPENATLLINGKDVSSDYITSSESMVPGMEDLYNEGNQWQIPYMVEYTVSGFIKEPQVSVVDNDVTTEISLNEDGYYVYPFSTNQDFPQENSEWIIGVTEAYGKYITKDAEFGEVSRHLLFGSEVFRNIQTLEIRWYAEHQSYEFKNQEVDNYKVYSDKCFSCDVHFQQIIYCSGEATVYNTDLNWTFVKKNGNWLIAKMEIIPN